MTTASSTGGARPFNTSARQTNPRPQVGFLISSFYLFLQTEGRWPAARNHRFGDEFYIFSVFCFFHLFEAGGGGFYLRGSFFLNKNF